MLEDTKSLDGAHIVKKVNMAVQTRNFSLLALPLYAMWYKWATSWENMFLPYANNKGEDKHA